MSPAMVLIFAGVFAASTSYPQYTGPPIDQKPVIARLDDLGYWVDTTLPPESPQNRQAIIAFQKLHGLKRTGKLTDAVVFNIWNASSPLAMDSMHLHHIEINLNNQVLLVVDSLDRIERILSVSTGNGERFFYPGKGWRTANTPRGRFRVYYKVKGWKKSELGMLYYPMYVVGGVAIHGAQSVPVVPASHGCIRIPVFAAMEMFRMSPIGTPVIVYGQNPRPH